MQAIFLFLDQEFEIPRFLQSGFFSKTDLLLWDKASPRSYKPQSACWETMTILGCQGNLSIADIFREMNFH